MDEAESRKFDNMRVGRLNVKVILNIRYTCILLLCVTVIRDIFHNHFSFVAIVLLQLIN